MGFKTWVRALLGEKNIEVTKIVEVAKATELKVENVRVTQSPPIELPDYIKEVEQIKQENVKMLKDIVSCFTELLSLDRQNDETVKKLQKSIDSYLTKFDSVEQKLNVHSTKIQELGDKFEGLLEILSERLAEKEDNSQFADIFSTRTNLREILKNKNQTSVMLAILYILKRGMEEKGTRI
jgi:hypothetical protein